MNPSPRPPSPSARAATQRAHRRDNPNQLSSRDAQILMGMAGKDKPTANGDGERPRLDSFFTSNVASASPSEPPATKKVTSSSSKSSAAPPRPSRETRRKFSTASQSTLDVRTAVHISRRTLTSVSFLEYHRGCGFDRVGKFPSIG